MPRLVELLVSFCALAALPAAALGQTDARAEAAAVEFFEKKVRPLLVGNCYTCHSANTNSQGGLRVDDRNGLLQGGRSGPAVVPGHPEKSQLLRKVRHADESQRMPPKKQLAPEQIADLSHWIKDGAAWPKVRVPADLGKPNPKYDKLRKEHWAWQPLVQVKSPAVSDVSWPLGDIDRFIRARLEEKGLTPAGDADRLTLLRRVTFDLTGLPPSPEEIDSFLKDASAEAFERVADRLLGSPAFGERWGRHWLDVARYGESTGSARNLPYPHAWRYRDYVIRAFNADKPYDQFLHEQIAGDLLPARTHAEREELLTATGFLALGARDVNQRFKVRFVMDNIDEQIDTMSRAVLALTASCARCHDHKFDPVPIADYYALAGIFHSTDLCAGVRNKMGGGGLDYYDPAMLLLLGSAGPPNVKQSEEIDKLKKALAQARSEIEALRGTPQGKAAGPDGRPKQALAREKMTRLQAELTALSDPATTGKAALGVREAQVIGDTEIRIRGEAEKLGPSVPRGFLSLIAVPDAPKINPKQSGRLELADWLASPKNPLTPRVMVNRVWQHLFGQGLVTSVDNFGITGDVPSHPQLLDHLAGQFIREGWSVKKLVRTIVLSRTYQLSAAVTAANLAADPANRFVWRHAPRRLDAEEIRDAMLAAAGTLEREPASGSPAQKLKVIELRNNGPEAQRLQDESQNSSRRSVYLPLLRGLTPRALEVFDFAEQGMVTGSRDTTTTAPQALYLLNDPFVRRQSLALAERLLRQNSASEEARIQLAYRLTVGRLAGAKEIARVKDYLADYESAARNLSDRPMNPDQTKETSKPTDPRTAAWASFCQAILAAAQFRYIK